MLRRILSVGGWTLVSRVTGFARDVVLAAVMGAGPIMDAFAVAQRLPNHFRAVFGEGAFNAAFVPAYARARAGDGATAGLFASRVWTLMIAIQLALLAAAIAFMPAIVSALAPGFAADPARFDLAVALTRITFPYLLLITLVTILSGILNAHDRFAAAAAAPVLLNVSIVAALALAALFPGAGHAAAWGVFAAGVLELALLWWAARRAGAMPRLARPRLDGVMKGFLRALGPAVVGSAGVQIALFADTIIASFLPRGAVSALYYADRLNQLPVGVVGIAAGTVLLPEMSRRIASGDVAGAHAAQNRAVGFTLALALPCAVAFVAVPDLIMRALFARGAFTAEDARAAGAVLAAYAAGLPAVVLIRSMLASFHARADTATPLYASLAAVAVNVGLKIVLTGPFGAAGLALATSAGAWVNILLLAFLAYRRDWTAPSPMLGRTVLAALLGAAALAAVVLLAREPLAAGLAAMPRWRDEALLVALAVLGAVVYGGVLVGGARLLGVRLARR